MIPLGIKELATGYDWVQMYATGGDNEERVEGKGLWEASSL
jgi:hypothetical protein